ncbi:MAG: hypothetical protein ACXQTD_06020 [Candidatus Syntropharchaeia archaeon]
MRYLIKNGLVYDPENGIDGEKMDIFLEDGKISEEIVPEKVIDVRGKVVMSGAIDIRADTARYGIDFFRFTKGFPTVREVGMVYARMGYIFLNEGSMDLHTSAHVHHILSSIPILDTSALVTLDPSDIAKEIRQEEKEEIKRFLSWLIGMTKASGIRVSKFEVSMPGKYWYMGVSREKSMKNLFPAQKELNIPKIHAPPMIEEKNIVEYHVTHITSAIKNDEDYSLAKKVIERTTGDMGLSDDSELSFALETDPWRLAFSADTSFEKYPYFLSALLEGGYSLRDIAIVTRAAPARFLGLKGKGNLSIGSDPGVVVYDIDENTPQKEMEKKLGNCKYLIKEDIVIKDFRIVNKNVKKKTYYRKSEMDGEITKRMSRFTSRRSEHMGVDSCFTGEEVPMEV